VQRQVLVDMWQWAEAQELGPQSAIRSPIEGSGGNVEFLMWLQPGREPRAGSEQILAGLALNG